MAATPSTRRFDDRNIQWQALGDFEHLEVILLGVDEENNIVDLMVKFAPNEKIFLHRHLALTNTLVVDGEHIIYEADGSAVKDVRPVGKYTSSPAGDAHLEFLRGAEVVAPTGRSCTTACAAIVTPCSMF